MCDWVTGRFSMEIIFFAADTSSTKTPPQPNDGEMPEERRSVVSWIGKERDSGFQIINSNKQVWTSWNWDGQQERVCLFLWQKWSIQVPSGEMLWVGRNTSNTQAPHIPATNLDSGGRWRPRQFLSVIRPSPLQTTDGLVQVMPGSACHMHACMGWDDPGAGGRAGGRIWTWEKCLFPSIPLIPDLDRISTSKRSRSACAEGRKKAEIFIGKWNELQAGSSCYHGRPLRIDGIGHHQRRAVSSRAAIWFWPRLACSCPAQSFLHGEEDWPCLYGCFCTRLPSSGDVRDGEAADDRWDKERGNLRTIVIVLLNAYI